MYKNNAVRWFLKSYYLLFDLYEIMRPGKSSERGGGGGRGFFLYPKGVFFILQIFFLKGCGEVWEWWGGGGGGGGMWLCITSQAVSYYCTTFYCRILSLYIYIYINNCLSQRERERERERERLICVIYIPFSIFFFLFIIFNSAKKLIILIWDVCHKKRT